MISTKIEDNNVKVRETIKEILGNMLRDLMPLLDAECGSLFLFDYSNKELVLDSLYNSCEMPVVKGLRQRIGEGVAGKVVDLKTPVLVRDIDKDPRFNRNGFSHYRTKSFISIPLFYSKGLLGVLNIADKTNGNSFSVKEFNFAVFLCKYVCLSIDNLINHKEMEESKESAERQKVLLEKYASVGKLATGVVHEINNPLDGIIRYANMLFVHIEHNSVAREYLLEMKKGLNRIADITKSLLEFSYQVNSNSSAKIKKYVDVHELIEESLQVLGNKLTTSIKIEKKFKTGLPRLLDFGFSHVFTNILKNALDAMPGGGTIEISTNLRDSMVEIGFKDTGLGMSADTKEHIFEPFFTTKSIDKGTGLGLAISNEIIKKYEGRIEVKSTEGKGSSFSILIPNKHLENA